jgi:hypothetical protein
MTVPLCSSRSCIAAAACSIHLSLSLSLAVSVSLARHNVLFSFFNTNIFQIRVFGEFLQAILTVVVRLNQTKILLIRARLCSVEVKEIYYIIQYNHQKSCWRAAVVKAGEQRAEMGNVQRKAWIDHVHRGRRINELEQGQASTSTSCMPTACKHQREGGERERE